MPASSHKPVDPRPDDDDDDDDDYDATSDSIKYKMHKLIVMRRLAMQL
jgi:hypothetical protein